MCIGWLSGVGLETSGGRMTQTYSPAKIPQVTKERCHDCGAAVDLKFVADRQDADGYVESIALCRQCAATREREASR